MLLPIYRLFPFLLLVICLFFSAFLPPVLGLFKLLDPNAQLVSNPRDNVVYLFQGPRMSTVPSLAAFTLKVEIWLHWHRIPFHRINNQVLLGSHTVGTVPFAYLNGKFIDGSDNIIEQVAKHFGKQREESKEEKKLRKMIDEELFKMLIFDRADNMKWMVRDEGFIEQEMPMIFTRRELSVPMQPNDRDGEMLSLTMNCRSWKAYFGAVNEPKRRARFMKKYLKKKEGGKKNGKGGGGMEDKEGDEEECEMADEGEEDEEEERKKMKKKKEEDPEEHRDEEEEDPGREEGAEAKMKTEEEEEDEQVVEQRWNTFNEWFRANVIEATMTTALLDNQRNPGNAQTKSKMFLKQNQLKGKDGKTRPYAEYSVEQIAEEIEARMEILREHLDKTHGLGLEQGETDTQTDAALFGVLIQFFETPLNNHQIRSLFAKSGPLFEFVQSVKKSVGLTQAGWEQLTKRPWIQNFDSKYIFKFSTMDAKYHGPYKLSVGDLDKDFFDRVNFKDDRVSFKRMDREEEKLPGEIVRAARRLVAMANRDTTGQNRYMLAQAMLSVMAAYVCETGQGKPGVLGHLWGGMRGAVQAALKRRGPQPGTEPEKGCTERHMKRAWDTLGTMDIKEHEKVDKMVAEVRKVVWDAVVEWNDARTKARVVAEIRKVQAEAAKGPEEAARVTSSTEFTNEL